MGRFIGALATLALLVAALLSATVDLHPASHPEGGQATVWVDFSATHAGETGHIEPSGTIDTILCPACIAPSQEKAGPREDRSHGAVLRQMSFSRVGRSCLPLVGPALSTAPRAPPLLPA